MNKNIILSIKIIIAVILLQTLPYKFGGHPDSIYIFESLNAEPLGRISSGIIELFCSILLFIPRYSIYAALSISMIMCVAILSHIIWIGIEINQDGGLLFITACILLLLSLIVSYSAKKAHKSN